MSDIDDGLYDTNEISDKLDRLDDVCQKLDDIEQAINNQSRQWGSWGNWIFWGAVFWLAVPPLFSDMWHSKFRYTVQYGVTYDQVTIEKAPYDCNFLHAPIGGKGCHYERQVTASTVKGNQWGGQDISYDDGKTWIRKAKNANGDPIVSFDDGKTWSISSDTGKASPSVSMSWEKKDD
jgi:hypothetical protein